MVFLEHSSTFCIGNRSFNYTNSLFFQVNRNFGQCYSWPQEFALNGGTTDASATYFLGKSPFPAVDAFIESVATVGNVSGGIL